jgi:2-polyprenyl-6-methoxyphenol hydroxylase-like FAD-dependent oxidoreductase
VPAPLDVVVVGAGPVGLLAGLLAHDAGLRVRVLDRAPGPCTHSRAIGIHPPALTIMARLPGPEGSCRTLADVFVEAGIRVCRGHALAGPGRHLGSLDFRMLEPPWSFVLTLPQHRTERILEDALRLHAPGVLVRSTSVTGIRRSATGGMELAAVGPEGKEERFAADYVLGCDGKRSILREKLGIGFEGGPYPHRYLMGDFRILEPRPGSDGVSPGRGGVRPDEAAIYLAREGLVESFPLEAGVRRWVIQRGGGVDAGGGASPVDGARTDAGTVAGAGADADQHLAELIATVRSRTGAVLAPEACRMISAFGVERYHATRVWQDRVVLLGDAAHVVSPIGGQGMNLGWIHAREAVEAIRGVLHEGVPESPCRPGLRGPGPGEGPGGGAARGAEHAPGSPSARWIEDASSCPAPSSCASSCARPGAGAWHAGSRCTDSGSERGPGRLGRAGGSG